MINFVSNFGICFIFKNIQFNKPQKFKILFRDNDESYARGVLSYASYKLGKKRSLVSLRMCIIGWLVEVFGTLCHVLFIWLNDMGLGGMHHVEAVTMFIIIPSVYLMNDEDTKGVIIDEGWYQGLKYMLGLRDAKSTKPR